MAKRISKNTSKDSNQNEGNIVVRWLKKIFSSQRITITLATLSLIVGCFSLYYTYLGRRENSPGYISIVIETGDMTIPPMKPRVDATGVSDFWGVAVTNYHNFSINDAPFCIRIPSIINDTEKNLKNFYCEIEINYGELTPFNGHHCTHVHLSPEDDLNCPLGEDYSEDITQWPYLHKDFEVIETKSPNGSVKRSVVYKYKNDIFYCHTSLPFPISEIYIPYKDRIRKNGFDFDVYYDIAYDGVKEPIKFGVHYQLFYDKNHPEGPIQKQYVNLLLDKVYDNNYLRFVKSKYDEPGWCLLINHLEYGFCDCDIVENIVGMSKDSYEKYQYNNIQELSRNYKKIH